MTTIVTGWTGRGYDALGAQFVRSFEKHWPPATRFAAYVDVPLASYEQSLWDNCPGLRAFVDRWRGNLVVNGRSPRMNWPKQQSLWKPRETAAGYSFRFDAVKFAPQLFIPEAAARQLPDGELLAWFDADVVTFADVPSGFLEGLIGDADVVYLGRAPKHSEIGFWAVRLNARSRRFLTLLADRYRTDSIFELAEWHSAFVFDHVREMAEATLGLRSRDLTPGGRGHVWFQSPLGKVTDHLKGKRKALGRSKERT